MCESSFCLQLKGGLDAAFRGEPVDATTPLGAWVKEFMGALKERFLDTGCPARVIWHFTDSIFQNMIRNCPCEGLAESIVSRPPEAFLRSIVLMARMHAPRMDGSPPHPAALN